MTSPDYVRCSRCGQVYDLRRVTPLGRYADCTTFKTPCCDWLADDRTGLSLRFYEHVAVDRFGAATRKVEEINDSGWFYHENIGPARFAPGHEPHEVSSS